MLVPVGLIVGVILLIFGGLTFSTVGEQLGIPAWHGIAIILTGVFVLLAAVIVNIRRTNSG